MVDNRKRIVMDQPDSEVSQKYFNIAERIKYYSGNATDGLAKIATEEIESFVQGSTVEYVKAPNDTVIEDTSLKVKLVYIIIGLLAGLGIGAAIYALKEPKKKGQQTKVDTEYTLLGSIPKY